uniref:Polygalacturonase n=1 Tax=Kalanchoe fedtschenkoi TaxID=63787 RepID=A0A7N0SZ59_KALFE
MAPRRNSFVANATTIFTFGILALICFRAEASGRGLLPAGGPVFDVTKYGATPNGKENAQAFIKAWVAACAVKGGATVLIPKGEFLVGEVYFTGPCGGKMTVNVEGNLKAPKDSTEFPAATWFTVSDVDGVQITGTGSFDGVGQEAWKFDDCLTNLDCVLAATNIKVERAKNVNIQGITSINSKAYHFYVTDSQQVTITGVKILTNGGLGLNTDGVHISRSSFVNVVKNYIESGEDCVSVGYGSSNVNIDGVTCKGGDGINIGVSAGRRLDMEKDIVGVIVKGSQLIDTKHGFKIKTGKTVTPMQISDVNIDGVQMTNVGDPIIIDQMFGGVLSSVRVNKVTFANIKGTTPSKTVANLFCSKLAPCGVTMKNVNLTCPATKKPVSSSVCSNVLGATFCQ